MPNDVPISDAALAITCQYPVIKTRMDMSFDEYTVYQTDWNIFNRIWAYNYTVRALGSGNYYQFVTDSERISYIKGQSSHVSVYSDAASAGVFNHIP